MRKILFLFLLFPATVFAALYNPSASVDSPVLTGTAEINAYYSPTNTCTTTLSWADSNVQYMQLANGAQTFTFANPMDGGRYILILKQPASGAAGTVVWPNTVSWPGAVAPVLTTTNSQIDVFSFVYNSANDQYFGGYSLNYAP